MAIANHKKVWKDWSNVSSWEIFTCPGRPSRDDIRHYNNFLKTSLAGKTRPEILSLGCTPETRDCLAKYSFICGAKITCVDMSKDMYKAMSQLTEIDNQKNETFVLSSWIEMKFEKKFDVIIGDYVNCNIDKKDKDAYYKNIASLLKDDGHFINRDFVITDWHVKRGAKKMSDLFNEYADKVKNEEITLKESSSWIGNELLTSSFFSNEEDKVSLEFVKAKLYKFGEKLKKRKLIGDEVLIKVIYDHFINTWFKIAQNKYWIRLPQKENDRWLKRFFKIKKIVRSNDYAETMTRYSPIYLLGKK